MIHFFSCIFTGNLRTSYIVIFPIFQQQTDPDKTSSSWGGRRGARNNTGAPGTLGATRPAESLLGFLPEKLPEKLHPCTESRIKQKIFTLQFSKQSAELWWCTGPLGALHAAHPLGSRVRLSNPHGSGSQASLQLRSWAGSLGLKQMRANLIHTASTTLRATAICEGVWASRVMHAGLLSPQPLSLTLPGLHREKQSTEPGRGFHSCSSRRVTTAEIPSLHRKGPGNTTPTTCTPDRLARNCFQDLISVERTKAESLRIYTLTPQSGKKKKYDPTTPGTLQRAREMLPVPQPQAQPALVLLAKERAAIGLDWEEQHQNYVKQKKVPQHT